MLITPAAPGIGVIGRFVNANPNAPTIMIAEKAADLILAARERPAEASRARGHDA